MQLNPHKSDRGLTVIAGPFLAPRRLVITDTTSEFPYNFEATLEPQGGRYEITHFTFIQREGGPPIQRGEIATVRLEPFQRWARDHLRILDTRAGAEPQTMFNKSGEVPHPWTTYEGKPTRLLQDSELETTLERLREKGLRQDAELEDLATLYRWYRIAEGRPTTLLAKDLEVSPATVKRYLAKAVETGALTDEERTR